MTGDEFIHGVAMAAATWNDNANAGAFQFIGGSSLTDIPESASACANQGITYSLVIIDNSSGAKGEAQARCGGAQFRIRLRVNNGSGTAWNWGTVPLAATEWDFVQTLSHEFGHTLGPGHPNDHANNSGVAAVLTPTRVGSTAQRDLYQWDHKCSHETSGTRKLSAYRRHISSSTFGSSAQVFSPDDNMVKGTPGITWDGSTDWSVAARLANCTAWSQGFSTANTNCVGSINLRVGVGPREATWREDVSNDRMFYSDYLDWPTQLTDWDSTHRVRYRRSTDGFNSSIVSGTLSHCNGMTGWFSCNTSVPVQSGKLINFAWLSSIGRTVSIWVNQNRQDDNADREMMVSVGHISHLTLAEPDGIGIRSKVSPGIACQSSAANGGDCIVAYVDHDDAINQVRIARLQVSQGTNRYDVVADHVIAQLPGNSPTAHNIDAWYHAGKFWVAITTA